MVPQLDLPPASRRTAAFFGVAWVVVIAAAAALTQISSGFWAKLWTGLLTTAGSVLFAASGLGLVLDYRRRTRCSWRAGSTKPGSGIFLPEGSNCWDSIVR